MQLTTQSRQRKSGVMLLELTIGLMIFVVGLLGYLGTYFSSAKNAELFTDLDAARISLDNTVEMLMQTDFNTLYTIYNGKTLDAKTLAVATKGTTSPTVSVVCYVDETNIPAEFGPLNDLNGNMTSQLIDVSASYKVLPMKLTAQYIGADGNTETLDAYCILDGKQTQKVVQISP